MKLWKICFVAVAIVSLPLLFQANTGCGLSVVGLCADPCLEDGAHSNPNSYVCSCTCNSPALFHKEVRVLTSADDAEQKTADNTVDIVSPDLDFSSARLVGIRFQGVDVPIGATITKAAIQFAATVIGGGNVTLRIKAQNDADPGAFSAVANNISSRPLLATHFVDWNPPLWNALD